MVLLRQDAVAVAVSDDRQRLGRFEDELLVLLGGEQVEQLRQEGVAQPVVADEQSTAQLGVRSVKSASTRSLRSPKRMLRERHTQTHARIDRIRRTRAACWFVTSADQKDGTTCSSIEDKPEKGGSSVSVGVQ